MILFKFLYIKLIKALFISFGVSYSIFFLFSLFGNFAEKHSFLTVLIVSFINSFQIFTYIPSFLIISSIFLMVYSLKSKNELVIIKEYMKISIITLCFMPIILTFSIVESNKTNMSSYLDDLKSKFLSNKNFEIKKLFINEDGNKKSFIILKGVDYISNNIDEYLSYQIEGNVIKKAEFSNNIINNNNAIYTKSSVIYEKNNISSYSDKKVVIDNFNQIYNNQFFSKNNISKNMKFNFIQLNSLIFYVVFYLCIFLFFFNRNVIQRNYSYFNLFYFSLIIFLYSLVVSNISLSNNNFAFHLISTSLLITIFFKLKIND